MRVRAFSWLLGGSCLLWTSAAPGVGKDLPYPTAEPAADTIAQNVYFVNHAYAVRNLSQRQDGDRAAFMLIRAADGSTRLYTFERFLNNEYDDGVTKARDLAVFRSGNLRGTGILTTVYQDEGKRQDVLVWMPALRKARRHAEPPMDDAWGGSNLTYADIYLRKPEHETHELMGRERFDACLDFPELRGDLTGALLRHAPQPRCDQKGRAVYKLKSTSRLPNCCYDYRIQYVDTQTFADYRTLYYQAEKPVKVLDKDWVSMGLADPRGQYARYWYARSLDSAVESVYAVPDGLTHWDADVDPSLWTEAGLGRITR